ncbi:MAG: pseudouridine synthase [Candidatus Omnitrophota bacterium]
MVVKLRLQVALAKLGFASRRSAVELIQAGRVKVNGENALFPSERVDLEKDKITVDGQSSFVSARVYCLLNKPKDVVCTVKDKYAGRTVIDIVGKRDTRIYPVGRLDKDTTGLLLLTNDGELAFRLTHPKFGIVKIYHVCVSGCVNRSKIGQLEQGIILEGKRTYPCKIGIIKQQKKETTLEVCLTEGRKRQIKKMFMAVGHPVLAIQRTAFGPLKLANLEEGRWRALSSQEVARLKQLCRLKTGGEGTEKEQAECGNNN